MPVAPWRSLISGALHRNRSLVYARYLQLATVRPNGRPANRTVVFRGFYDPTNQLQFVTDRCSEKVSQIAHCSWGEACWYFPKTREQFRLSGELTLIYQETPDPQQSQLRQTLWQQLSEASRSQFYWPHLGKAQAGIEELTASQPLDEDPPDSFCLLLLQPHQVDHLELQGTPQNRHFYYDSAQQEWVAK